MLRVVQFAAQCTKELKTGQVLVQFGLRFSPFFNRTDRQKTGLSSVNLATTGETDRKPTGTNCQWQKKSCTHRH